MGRKIEEYKLELDKNPNIFLSYVLVMRNRQSFQPGIMDWPGLYKSMHNGGFIRWFYGESITIQIKGV